jgi:hypothetical protein
MKKVEKILKNIMADKKIMNQLKKMEHYKPSMFVKDGMRYLKAVEEGRIQYNVESVSASGMTRQIKILSCERIKGKKYSYTSYISFLEALGFKTRDFNIIVRGCGMDMLFVTNRNIILSLKELGFISHKKADVLAQAI